MNDNQETEISQYEAIIAETSLAWLIQFDEETEIWLPKSQCRVIPDSSIAPKGTGMISIPEWLAEEKGL